MTTSSNKSEQIAELEAALEWYGEQARLSRFVHDDAHDAWKALFEDGGRRAFEANPKSAPDFPSNPIEKKRPDMNDAKYSGLTVAAIEALAKGGYMMSEPHLSGFRLIIGFDKSADADDAMQTVAKAVKAVNYPSPEAASPAP